MTDEYPDDVIRMLSSLKDVSEQIENALAQAREGSDTWLLEKWGYIRGCRLYKFECNKMFIPALCILLGRTGEIYRHKPNSAEHCCHTIRLIFDTCTCITNNNLYLMQKITRIHWKNYSVFSQTGDFLKYHTWTNLLPRIIMYETPKGVILNSQI